MTGPSKVFEGQIETLNLKVKKVESPWRDPNRRVEVKICQIFIEIIMVFESEYSISSIRLFCCGGWNIFWNFFKFKINRFELYFLSSY